MYPYVDLQTLDPTQSNLETVFPICLSVFTCILNFHFPPKVKASSKNNKKMKFILNIPINIFKAIKVEVNGT